MNYKVNYTYWLVDFKNYDCLISASKYYFKKETIEFFKNKYPVSLFFSYDNNLNFCCGPICDIEHFYEKRKYKYMGNFSLKDDRKKKLQKLSKNETILEST